MEGRDALLEGEEDPVVLVNGQGASPVLLVCEHAGRTIPKALGTLGLEPSDLTRHIAWDIGAEGLARGMAAKLDAALVLQRYSRLVYDCNRPPESPGAMPPVSESTRIPGNEGLSAAERRRRTEAIYTPFHAAIARQLDLRLARGEAPVLVTIHSFTPVYKGERRFLDVGILHDRDARLADAMLESLASEPGLDTRRNEPYGPQDGVTHTLVKNALSRGIANVMIEVRNDLILRSADQAAMAERLARHVAAARDALERTPDDHVRTLNAG